jgi:[ribosomal protein S5]-alanine N-acetyltransferase
MNEIIPLDLSCFFEQHPVLETERLILRPITMADAEDVFDYAKDSESNKYMPWPIHRTIEDTYAYFETIPKNHAARERLGFAITLKPNGKFIGSCDFHSISVNHHRVMMGYVLNRKYWGNGYMTETVRELIRFALEEMGMHRVAATCDEDNIRSARVMERCGMALEGVFRDYEVRHGAFVSTKSYAIIKRN